MKLSSAPDLGRNNSSSNNAESNGHPETGLHMGRIGSRAAAFFTTYRTYLLLLLVQGLVVWMAFNWYGIVHRMVDYYTSLPIYDYWRVVQDFPQCKALHFQFLWRQHNEHRIIFPEIVFLLDMIFWHGRQYLPLAASFLCYFSIWLAIAWIICSDACLSRFVRITAVLLAGIVMGWEGTVSLLAWPFLLQWTLMQAAAIFSLAWLSAAGSRKSANKYVALAIAAAVVVNYSSGNGLLFWPVLVAVGFLLPLRKRQRAALIISSAVSVGCYFIGYHFSNSLNLANFFYHPFYSIGFIATYLSMPFGAINVDNSPAFGVYLGLFNLAALICFVIFTARTGLLKTRPVVVLVGFYCFALLTAVITAAGRMNPADPTFGAAKPPRYVTVPLVNWAVLLSLGLWLAGRRRWRLASSIMTLGFIISIMIGFSRLNWWVQSSNANFADVQEAILSVEDNLAVPRLMNKIFPSQRFIHHYLPALQANHLSIYYKSRTGWLGLPASQFGQVHSSFVPGSITDVSPVRSGVEISGWADDGREPIRYRWIILVNEANRIVGFAERFPAGTPNDPMARYSENARRLGWIGFADPSIKSKSYRAYMVDPAGLYPLRGSFPVPPFALVGEHAAGAPIAGINWQMDSNLKSNTIPSIIRLNDTPQGPVFSTWSGSDANTGQIRSSAFKAANCIVLPVLHGPSPDGLSVKVWNAGTHHLIGTVPTHNSDQQWEFWRLDLDSSVQELRINVDDQGRGWGQWVAVAQPSLCR